MGEKIIIANPKGGIIHGETIGYTCDDRLSFRISLEDGTVLEITFELGDVVKDDRTNPSNNLPIYHLPALKAHFKLIRRPNNFVNEHMRQSI